MPSPTQPRPAISSWDAVFPDAVYVGTPTANQTSFEPLKNRSVDIGTGFGTDGKSGLFRFTLPENWPLADNKTHTCALQFRWPDAVSLKANVAEDYPTTNNFIPPGAGLVTNLVTDQVYPRPSPPGSLEGFAKVDEISRIKPGENTTMATFNCGSPTSTYGEIWLQIDAPGLWIEYQQAGGGIGEKEPKYADGVGVVLGFCK